MHLKAMIFDFERQMTNTTDKLRVSYTNELSHHILNYVKYLLHYNGFETSPTVFAL